MANGKWQMANSEARGKRVYWSHLLEVRRRVGLAERGLEARTSRAMARFTAASTARPSRRMSKIDAGKVVGGPFAAIFADGLECSERLLMQDCWRAPSTTVRDKFGRLG